MPSIRSVHPATLSEDCFPTFAAGEAIPSLYTLCQLKVCEYTLKGDYDCRDVRAGVAQGMADDIFATHR